MITDVVARATARFAAVVTDDLIAKLVRGGLVALIIKVGAAGLSFLMFLVLARAMSIEEYGRFGFAFSLATFLSVVASIGMHTGILRWWPEYEGRNEPGHARAALKFGGVATLAAATVLALVLALAAGGHTVWGAGGYTYLWGAAALIIPLALSEYVASAMRARGSVAWALMPKDIVWRLAVFAAGAAAILFAVSLSALSALWLLTVLLAILVLAQIGKLLKDLGPVGVATAAGLDSRPLVAAVLPMWGAAMLSALTQHVDVLLLGIFTSPEQTGPYFAAVRIANLLNLMLVASNMVSAPLISRLYYKGEQAQLQRTLRFIAIGIAIPTLAAFLLIVAFGGWLLEWFGAGFSVAYWPLVLLSGGFAFNALCGPTGYVLQMTGLERSYLKIMMITYACVIGFQLIAIPALGMLGAAMGSAAGLVSWNLWSRHVGISRAGLDPTILALGKRSA